MPSKSKNQQKFFGMVRAYQKGDVKDKDVSSDVKKAAKSMSKKEVKDFASTSHKGLPTRVKEKKRKTCENIGRMLRITEEQYNEIMAILNEAIQPKDQVSVELKNQPPASPGEIVARKKQTDAAALKSLGSAANNVSTQVETNIDGKETEVTFAPKNESFARSTLITVKELLG